jgi:hypothetical protein
VLAECRVSELMENGREAELHIESGAKVSGQRPANGGDMRGKKQENREKETTRKQARNGL